MLQRLDNPLVPIAYRAPFAISAPPWIDQRPHGETLLEMIRSVPNLPRLFLSRGIVCINGESVPRELWSYVRPKPAMDNLPIAVTLHWALGSPGGAAGGGGRSTTKSIIGLVAALALIVVTQGIATGFVGGLLGISAIGAGSFGALALSAAVGVAGALAISALTAPPTQEAAQIAGAADVNSESKESASASGNVLNPGGAIPRVIGTRKIFPPFICEPVVELVGEDEIVEILLALNGPHLLEDIRADGVLVSESEDITSELREGWPSDSPIELVTRQGRTTAPQITLSVHTLDSDDVSLLHQSLPESDLPIWHGVVSRDSPDEIWLHLLFPGGISTGSASLAVPLRIRMRLRGADSPGGGWINLPEMHVEYNNTSQFRLAVVFKWQEISDGTEPLNGSFEKGFYYANFNPQTQTVTPATPAELEWTADAYFDKGSGNRYYFAGAQNTSRIRNINLFQDRAEIYLKEATFPRGIYEIEIKRGFAYLPGSFTKTSYVYAGTIRDFFWYSGTAPAIIAQDRTNYSDRCMLVRVISIWNEHPVAQGGFALIAITAINRQIQRISTQASGYVRDLDSNSPPGWTSWTTSSNPAPHYVDILCGDQNLDPLPSDLRDDAGLIAWRTLCASNNWTCDAIIDDMRIQDALQLLASCAYAKPYQSDQYGVTVDNDRTAESPIQVFSRINASNVRFEKAFARVPEGFVVSYRDNASDDDRAQTVVYQRDRSIATTGLLESISYEGLVELNKVETRALFDLDQTNQRSTFYSLETDIESIVCRRGSLVALQHDVLTSRAGDAHVVSLSTGSPSTQIVGLTLDAKIPITNEPDLHSVADMHLIADLHDVGVTTCIAIRRTDGSISTHTLSDATGESDAVTFAVPIDPNPGTIIGFNDTNREYGCLIVAGECSTQYLRMLVLSITPGKDLTASIVLVDEAPDLIRFAA